MHLESCSGLELHGPADTPVDLLPVADPAPLGHASPSAALLQPASGPWQRQKPRPASSDAQPPSQTLSPQRAREGDLTENLQVGWAACQT